jgi:hypothetical protein
MNGRHQWFFAARCMFAREHPTASRPITSAPEGKGDIDRNLVRLASSTTTSAAALAIHVPALLLAQADAIVE